jgi:hypothetical protein
MEGELEGIMEDEVEWIQCTQCSTWLRVPKDMNLEDFDQDWICSKYPNNGTCIMKSNISLYDISGDEIGSASKNEENEEDQSIVVEKKRKRRRNISKGKYFSKQKFVQEKMIQVAKSVVDGKPFVMLKSRVEVPLNDIVKGTCLNRNIVIVVDKTTKDIVLITKFTPFNVMEVELKTQVERFTRTLIQDLIPSGYSITGNAAHRGGTGKMYAMGWRPGFDTGFSVGCYVISPNLRKKPGGLQK